MDDKAKELRELVEQLKNEFGSAQEKLRMYVSSCKHQFSEPKYAPIYTPAYTIPGDTPGTKQWKRECSRCGETQYTKRTKEQINFEGLKYEVPDFLNVRVKDL